MSTLHNNLEQLQNLFNEKKFDKIIQLGKPLLIKFHNDFDVNFIIGTSNLANNKLDTALSLLIKANKINPSSSICLLNIAICYKLLKNFENYKKYLDLANFSAPDNVDILYELGSFYLNVNEIHLSIYYYEKVIKFKSKDLNFVLNISESYLRAGKPEKASEICHYYIKNETENPLVFNTLAVAYKNMGDFKNAKLFFSKSIRLAPNFFQSHRNLSSLIKYKVSDKHFIEMRSLYFKNENNIELNLALSKAYKDIGENQRYFMHLDLANKNIRKKLNYKPDEEKIKFSRIKLIFKNKSLKRGIIYNQMPSPIFILGLPRSGTTLIENIISSHSKVHAGGELDTLQNLGYQILKNNNDSLLCEDTILKYQKHYLKSLSNVYKNKLFVTDKMPLNFLWIGLIFNCFPNAKVIHSIRNPVATCWSLFNTYFSGNGNSFSYNQNDIYEYYNLYFDLMKYWNILYPRKIFNLNYENLVINPNIEIKKLLKYCMLEIENNCFQPHLNSRQISTASSLQVRQPIYAGSKNDWKTYKDYITKDILSLNHKNLND